MNRATVITSSVRRNLSCADIPCKSELDDQSNQRTIVDIVRKLIINGGRVKMYNANDSEVRYERLSIIV
ncbi:hypothetical protein QUS22_03330 [Wolbachia pipientis]|nr:hypothetical protein [Wolbachia pipientis]